MSISATNPATSPYHQDEPQFLPLEEVDAYTFHGVKVTTLGEDGDMGEVAFTHDRRRAIAATVALHRREYRARVDEVFAGNPQWWRIVANCGCGPTCKCPLDSEGDPEHRCKHFGLPPCLPEGLTWIGLVCAEDDPGALPVIELEVAP